MYLAGCKYQSPVASFVQEYLSDNQGYCRRPDLEDGIIKIDISKLRMCFYAHKKRRY